MAQAPYIPAQNGQFATWLANFSAKITASPTTYGLVTADATTIAAQNTAYQAAYTAATTPSTRTSVTVAALAAARATAEAVIRPYAVSISLNAGVTNDAKTAVGVTVRKTVPTPVPPPTTAPQLALVSAIPLNQTLQYRDVTTPTSKAKPPGAISLQVWANVGTAPATDPAQCLYFATWTKSPNVATFTSAQQGKIVTYFGRWATRGGPGGAAQYGPWSAPLVLTIQ
jgi:hypothetical protein